MKRDRLASDYERIRRDAGLRSRDFQPPPQAERNRVEEINDDFRARMEALNEAQAEAARRRKAEADILTVRANDAARLREFAAAGLEPPIGFSTSLSLLLQIGWKIVEVDGRKVLMRPIANPAAPAPRKTREQYAEESLKESF